MNLFEPKEQRIMKYILIYIVILYRTENVTK